MLHLICIALALQAAAGDFIVRVNLHEYSNPSGWKADGYPFEWHSACDPDFALCVSDGTTSGQASCNFGKFTTGVYTNKNQITFKEGDFLGEGVTNPLEWNVVPQRAGVAYEGKVSVSFKIQDVDTNTNDLISEFSKIVYVQAQPPSAATKDYPVTLQYTAEVNLNDELISTMKFSVSVNCAPNWYGPKCDKFCKDDSEGRYKCDPQTGKTICQGGWQGADCMTLCQGSFVCKCQRDTARVCVKHDFL